MFNSNNDKIKKFLSIPSQINQSIKNIIKILFQMIRGRKIPGKKVPWKKSLKKRPYFRGMPEKSPEGSSTIFKFYRLTPSDDPMTPRGPFFTGIFSRGPFFPVLFFGNFFPRGIFFRRLFSELFRGLFFRDLLEIAKF